MKTVIDYVEEYGGYSKEERLAKGKEALAFLRSSFLLSGVTEEIFDEFITDVAKLVVSADRDCNPNEYEYFLFVGDKLFGYEEFYRATDGGNSVIFKMRMMTLFKALPPFIREKLCVFALGLAYSDGDISEGEKSACRLILE